MRDSSLARAWWTVAGALAVLVALGLGGAWVMEHRGHVVTGMTNQVVWGIPHVFAIFLIVAASGALNVASIASAFREPAYKPYAPLSVLVALALLAGGLMVLVLDLGRPERLVVAATRYNFHSIFAWNMILYTGFFAIGATYLWTMLEKRFGRYSRPAGVLAFTWRIVLTTGTGSIFGFLVARQAYAAAVIAPLFIALSLAWGTAAFWVAQRALAATGGAAMDEEMERRLARLLGLFVVVVLWLTAVYHLTNLYWARQSAFERFILADGTPYPAIFWLGFVVLGSLVPLALLWHPRFARRGARLAASVLVLAGAVGFLYVFVIGGQAFPLDIFPGYAAASSFGDGAVARYVPSAPEVALGVAGVALAGLITAVGARLFAIPAGPGPAHP
jgi:Ni/Fe-hydrogenase subunit HybB-like protein